MSSSPPGITEGPPGDEISPFWSGLTLSTRVPSDDRFVSASGQFIVPEAHLPKAADDVKSGDFTAWVWVGLGNGPYGLGDGPHIIQAGVTANVHKASDGSESTSYGTWYEWFPANGAASTTTSQFPVAAGDNIGISIVLSSPTAGYVVWTNLRTHLVYRKDMSIPDNSPYALVATEAEFIVEDPQLNGAVPFANFGAVTFTNLVTVIRGRAPGAATSRTIKLVQTDKSTGKPQQLADATFDGGSVKVTYSGP